MPRENNFLIGQGERLTSEVEVPSGGSKKALPYDFVTQLSRLDDRLTRTNDYMSSLPPEACPNDKSVAIVTMHPRFIAKSDFPENLLSSMGLRAVGSRSVEVTPERWGTKRHPEQVVTDELFVVGTRESFAQWQNGIRSWREGTGVSEALRRIENVSAFPAEAKLRSVPTNRDSIMLEIVLHNAGDEEVIRSFMQYASSVQATVFTEKRRDVGGLTFFPVEASSSGALEVARHSFVRVARGMPTLRPNASGTNSKQRRRRLVPIGPSQRTATLKRDRGCYLRWWNPWPCHFAAFSVGDGYRTSRNRPC